MFVFLRNVLWVLMTPIRNLRTFIENKLRYRSKVSFTYSSGIGKGSSFEGYNSIAPGSYFSGKMGMFTYIAPDSQINGDVGRFTSIGTSVRMNRGVHPTRPPFVSTSPLFYSLRQVTGTTFVTKNKFDDLLPPITIGNDCWICSRTFFVGGVKIGDGAIVCAGAVVTKDVPPYAIVGGVPAKIIRYRYDEETIRLLMEFKWWDKPIEWIKEHSEQFDDIDKFTELMKKEIAAHENCV